MRNKNDNVTMVIWVQLSPTCCLYDVNASEVYAKEYHRKLLLLVVRV
jgi:hypothetical protein